MFRMRFIYTLAVFILLLGIPKMSASFSSDDLSGLNGPHEFRTKIEDFWHKSQDLEFRKLFYCGDFADNNITNKNYQDAANFLIMGLLLDESESENFLYEINGPNIMNPLSNALSEKVYDEEFWRNLYELREQTKFKLNLKSHS